MNTPNQSRRRSLADFSIRRTLMPLVLSKGMVVIHTEGTTPRLLGPETNQGLPLEKKG